MKASYGRVESFQISLEEKKILGILPHSADSDLFLFSLKGKFINTFSSEFLKLLKEQQLANLLNHDLLFLQGWRGGQSCIQLSLETAILD